MDGDVHLGCPTMVRARAQPVADHLLEPADGRLSTGPFRIPGGCLPGSSAVLDDIRLTSRFDVLKMAVPLRAHGLDRFARHGRGTRWHNNGSCMAPAEWRVATAAVTWSSKGQTWAEQAKVPSAWPMECLRRGRRPRLSGSMPPRRSSRCRHSGRCAASARTVVF